MQKCVICKTVFERLNDGEYQQYDEIYKTNTFNTCNKCLVKEEFDDFIMRLKKFKEKDFEKGEMNEKEMIKEEFENEFHRLLEGM